MDVRSYLPDTSLSSVEFSSFLGQFREKLDHIFNGRASQDELSRKRGVPPFVMREIRSCNPLSVYIPEEYGGRGGHIHEGQAVLAEASYQSLALSLTIGINGALFLQPFTKYGKEEAKADVFQRFLAQDNMG
ncbi:MAG: acyl-CoA dehydrogenase, partial [Bacteroidetes bacterium QS_8_64_10]